MGCKLRELKIFGNIMRWPLESTLQVYFLSFFLDWCRHKFLSSRKANAYINISFAKQITISRGLTSAVDLGCPGVSQVLCPLHKARIIPTLETHKIYSHTEKPLIIPPPSGDHVIGTARHRLRLIGSYHLEIKT